MRTRYRMLETVRLYAQDRLWASGETDRLRAAHSAWFQARAAALARGGPWFPPQISIELDADVDNLRQAIEWCRELERLEEMARLVANTVNEFHAHARFDEVEEWLQSVLALSRLPAALRSRCLTASALAAEMQGEFQLANEIAREAIGTAERSSDAGGAFALLVHNLAWVAPNEAERLLEDAEEWAAPLGSRALGLICIARAIVACARHQYPEALGYLCDAGVRGLSRRLTPWAAARR